MIKTKDAISVARSLIGTPYPTEANGYKGLDCINLVKKVIRTAPGGVADYTTATTVSLWESIGMSAKYRDLTWRQESIDGAKAGMVAFKRYNKPADHVGIVTERGTVIHASSVHGETVETDLTAKDGWNGLGIHRHIAVSSGTVEDQEEEEVVQSYTAMVTLDNPNDPDNFLNVRNEPSTKGDVIGKLSHGTKVVVQADAGKGWKYITYGGIIGYAHGDYIVECEPDPEPEDTEDATDNNVGDKITIIDSEGNRFEPVGDFRVLRGSID